MFCSKCGAENQAEASYCHKCGASLSGVGVQQDSSVSAAASGQSDAIWNPNATACWSLIFTPAFGSYLQMLNWKALGQSDKAASSQNWFYASLAILVAYVLMGIFMSDSEAIDLAAGALGLPYLLVWYFFVARSQVKFVREKFGSNYPKKPWGKALLICIAAYIGYLIFAVVVGFILGLILGAAS